MSTTHIWPDLRQNLRLVPRPGHSNSRDFVEVGTWRIGRLRPQPHFDFHPWGTPDYLPIWHRKRGSVNRDPLELARFYNSLLETPVVESRAGLARYLGVSRARVTQVLRRLKKPASRESAGSDQ